jgi:ATP-dependent RNA helicase DDX1
LQIVHETLRDIQEGNKGPRTTKSASTSTASNALQLSFYDRSHGLAIDSDGLTCQSRDQRMWNGARSTKGVKGKGQLIMIRFLLISFILLGRYYFEVTPTDTNGIVRMGWSVPAAQLDLGTDNQGFGYGGTGKKSFAKQFDDYGETFGANDTVGSLIDLDQMKIRYFKNGLLHY